MKGDSLPDGKGVGQPVLREEPVLDSRDLGREARDRFGANGPDVYEELVDLDDHLLPVLAEGGARWVQAGRFAIQGVDEDPRVTYLTAGGFPPHLVGVRGGIGAGGEQQGRDRNQRQDRSRPRPSPSGAARTAPTAAPRERSHPRLLPSVPLVARSRDSGEP